MFFVLWVKFQCYRGGGSGCCYFCWGGGGGGGGDGGGFCWGDGGVGGGGGGCCCWHFDETEQYDPKAKTGGLFIDYVNTFLEMKQEARVVSERKR